jgi:Leucine-rich repeat (LRR) protein
MVVGLDTLFKLRELHLDANELSVIENLAHMADLEVLVLNDNHISEISGKCVYECTMWCVSCIYIYVCVYLSIYVSYI